jgi:uncharacterized protein (TIGR02217 family)
MIDFTETRLELGYDYGAVGGSQFKTSIIETSDGREQRNAEWWLPLGRWQLGERILLESDIEGLHEVQYLKDFHNSRKGSKQGFRYKDWCDFEAINQYIGTGDGVTTAWQLKKTYYAGSYSTDRPITKPVVGTVNIYVNGVNVGVNPNHDWTINHSSGVISKASPLVSGTITVDFEFDVPVCFDRDDIGWRLEGYQEEERIYRLESVFVEEIRIALSLPWSISSTSQLNATLDLGIIYDTVESIEFDTTKTKVASGFERRDSNYALSKTRIDLGQKIFDREELDLILGFFWNARGKARSFDFKYLNQAYVKCIFNNDILNIKYEAEYLYSISNLDIIKTKELLITRQTYVVSFADSSSSMDDHIPIIQETISRLKTSLQYSLYDGSESLTNKYIKNPILNSSEQWLSWLNTDPRSETSELNKVIFLIWINESDPSYHGNDPFNISPTITFLNHLNVFLSNYSNRQTFKALIYSPNPQENLSSLPIFTAFNNHLLAAIEGSNNYPVALKDYNIEAKINVPLSIGSDFYLQDLL